MVVSTISAATGIPEQNLTLVLSILFGYLIAVVYRITLLRPLKSVWAPFIRNLYVVVSGLSISYFFNGSDIKHSLITTIVTWLFCYFGELIGNRKLACGLSFIFNITYLVVGYYVTATDEYDIDWTMPQCVLCLRMIGFAMDFMDGAKSSKSSVPPLIETIGYAYFFGAFLIGPQFSFNLYRKFITMTLYPDPKKIPAGSSSYALKSFLLGALYLGVQQIAAGFFPMAYVLTEEYAAKPLIKRLAYMWMAGKFSFTKYLGIWTLAEGSCILSGISFNGYDANGNPEWNGLANVEKMKFEFATSLNQIVGAFNTNTNIWTKIYIFKRLIFLGNKNLSSLGALFFLALWHGIYSGYFICFSLEYVDIETEKRWAKRVEPYVKPLYDPKNESKYKTIRGLHKFACWFGQTCGLHYAMVSFELLKWDKVVTAYSSVYWIGHVIVFTLLFADTILPKRRAKNVEKIISLDEKVNNGSNGYVNGVTKVKEQ